MTTASYDTGDDKLTLRDFLHLHRSIVQAAVTIPCPTGSGMTSACREVTCAVGTPQSHSIPVKNGFWGLLVDHPHAGPCLRFRLRSQGPSQLQRNERIRSNPTRSKSSNASSSPEKSTPGAGSSMSTGSSSGYGSSRTAKYESSSSHKDNSTSTDEKDQPHSSYRKSYSRIRA